MKSALVIACLLGLSFGVPAVPAHAFNISFGNYDRNRDGRWDRDEYYAAHRDWHRYNDHHYLPKREVYKRYRTYDRDGDGYLDDGEVREIHEW